MYIAVNSRPERLNVLEIDPPLPMHQARGGHKANLVCSEHLSSHTYSPSEDPATCWISFPFSAVSAVIGYQTLQSSWLEVKGHRQCGESLKTICNL